MNRFWTFFGLGLGIAVGGGLLYAFVVSETFRLLAVGLGAFLLAALTIGGTALLVNRQWANTLGRQRTTHHHRYQLSQLPAPAQTWEPPSPDLLPPLELDLPSPDEQNDIVA
jgi:hypothetical protein